MGFRQHLLGATALILLLAAPEGAIRGAPATALVPQPLEEGLLDKLRWTARPVVVLGTGPEADTQLAHLQAEARQLRLRDVVLLVDGPGAARLRDRVGPGFAVLLIGKDGGVKLSRNSPVAPSEIIALIDSMPMRQREAAEQGE